MIASALEPIPGLGRVSSPDGAVTLMLSDIADARRRRAARVRSAGSGCWAITTCWSSSPSPTTTAALRFERDGFLASFNSAHAGLHAAIELQRTFTGARRRAAADRDPRRPALGVRDRQPRPAAGPQRGARGRIAAQAKGGEILVSATLKQYTETDPSFRFEAHGEHHFKGVLGEHAVYSVQRR